MKQANVLELGSWFFVLLLSVSVSSAFAAKPVYSLRGTTALNKQTSPPALSRWQRDRRAILRDCVQQPPLIPHKIRDYKITRQHNKCMICHSWANYQKVGATKISQTHFRDRSGSALSKVSPRRYFCTQCHVPQKAVKPLVGNDFKSVRTLRRR